MKSFTKIEPLSNIQIIDKCREIKIKNFKGIFMRDELKGRTSENECFILNHDISSNNGTHWTCLFVKNGIAFYFDSFGLDPPLEILNYYKGLESIVVLLKFKHTMKSSAAIILFSCYTA
jgi:hypothetical protein